MAVPVCSSVESRESSVGSSVGSRETESGARELESREGPFWEPNATGHCSRWFQRFGRIPGSLNIYYAISTCWYIQMTATYTLLQVLSRHSAALGVIEWYVGGGPWHPS